MAVELGVGYITLVPSARGITQTIEAQLGGPLVAAGRKSGDATSAAFAGTFKKGLSGIQKGLLGTIGVAGIGVGLVKVGESFENAFATIARGTGATGAELEGLDKSFKTVLKNGAGSFDQVSTAITKLNQRTGLTGKALEDFAAKEVTLARITKTDVAANLESTTALFNLYGIAAGAQSDKLDLLFKASQLAGVSITELAGQMQAAAPTAKILGFSIDKTAAFVAQLDRAGLPAGKVMQGLAGAFSKAAKDGKAPLDVIHDLVEEVKRAPTPTAAATIAIQKFGIGARQASTLVAGLRSGAIDLDKSLSGKGILATAAATSTLSGKLNRLKNEALVGLEPLATDALGALTRGLELALPLVTALTDHMDVLGPILLTAAAGFVAFKVAAGISATVNAATAALTTLRAAVFGTSGALTAEAEATTGATVATKGLTTATFGLGAALTAVGAGFLGGRFLGHKINSFLGGAKPDVDKLSTSLVQFSKTGKTSGAVAATFGASLKTLAADLKTVKGSAFNKGFGFASSAHRAVQDIQSVNQALEGVLKTEGVKAAGAAFQQVRDQLVALGVPIETINSEFNPFLKALGDTLPTAADNAGTAMTGLAKSEADSAGTARSAAAAQDQLRIAATNLTTAVINDVDRLRGLEEGLVGVLQSAINLRQGLVDLRDKQAAYNKAVKDNDPRKTAAALRDLELAQLGQIGNTKAAIDAAEKQADAQSHLTDHLKTQADAQAALQKIQADSKSTPEQIAKAQDDLDRSTKAVSNSQKIQIQVLTALADRVKGPLHVALLQYLHDINVIPNLKATKVETPGLDAAFVRTHNYRGEMDHLPALKATRITLDAGQAFTTLAEFRRQVNLIPNNVSFKQAIAFEGGRLAKGGRAQPGRDYLIGEEGTELLRMYATGGAYVFSNPELRRKGIPELADGGVFKKPTIAVVGESARTTPEIVSPVRLMAETFRQVLKTTLSTSVVNTTTSKTQITADAVDAVRTVRGYVVELAKMPKTVTTTIAADTKQAAGGFADLAGAVSVSDAPFQKVSSQIREIGTSTETVEKRFKKSARTIREVVNTSADLRTKEPSSAGLLAAPRRPDVTPLVIPSSITPPALPRLPKPDPFVIAARLTSPRPPVLPKVAPVVVRSSVLPPTVPPLPKVGPLAISARIATPTAPTIPRVRPLVVASRIAPLAPPSLPHVDPLILSTRFAKVVPPALPKIETAVVPTRFAEPKPLKSLKPVASTPAHSGKFAVTVTPAASTVAPVAQLTPTFKTDLQRNETRSFVGVAKQEIHVDRQSFVEEINLANRKLGMRVAIAGRR